LHCKKNIFFVEVIGPTKICVSIAALKVQAKILGILKVKTVSRNYLERNTSVWKTGRAVAGKQSWGMFVMKSFFSVWRVYIGQSEKEKG